MIRSLEDRFGTAKPVIAMVHFPGLPGRPRHDRDAGRSRLLDVVGRDVLALQELDRERQVEGLSITPVNPALYDNAAKLELGVGDLQKIQIDLAR